MDVREHQEFMAQNIPGALLHPLAQLCLSTLPNWEGTKLVIHCRSGVRGVAACEKLKQQKPGLEIYHLEGGILSWIAAGYAVNCS